MVVGLCLLYLYIWCVYPYVQMCVWVYNYIGYGGNVPGVSGNAVFQSTVYSVQSSSGRISSVHVGWGVVFCWVLIG